MQGSLLITGSSGFIGGALARRAAGRWLTYGARLRAEDSTAVAVHHGVTFDIRDREQTQRAIATIAPTVVIHAAAMADSALCATHPELAWESNVHGAENVARAAAAVGARLIYLSTDWVFRGDRGGYTELDAPDPLTVYGKTKYAGEEAVRATCDSYVIARVALVFGYGSTRCPCFAERLLSELRAGRPVSLFQDEYRSPIALSTLCDCLLELAAGDGRGIYHLGGPDRLSRLEFGRRLAAAFDLPRALLLPTSRRDYAFPEPRPADCSLRTVHPAAELTTPRPAIMTALRALRWEYENAPKQGL